MFPLSRLSPPVIERANEHCNHSQNRRQKRKKNAFFFRRHPLLSHTVTNQIGYEPNPGNMQFNSDPFRLKRHNSRSSLTLSNYRYGKSLCFRRNPACTCVFSVHYCTDAFHLHPDQPGWSGWCRGNFNWLSFLRMENLDATMGVCMIYGYFSGSEESDKPIRIDAFDNFIHY